MSTFKSEDDLRPSGSSETEVGSASLSEKLYAVVRGSNPSAALIYALAFAVCLGLIVVGYVATQPPAKVAMAPKPVSAAASPWKPIAERLLQAQQGEFPVVEGTVTISKSLEAADGEVRSLVGTVALSDTGARQIESGESWGVTGTNHDEFVMYVHNYLNEPISAMVIRLSDGSCAAYGAQTATSWISAYLGDPLAGTKQAIIHAALPTPYYLSTYCAVVYRIYSSNPT
jgi:hypothetical protein